MNADEARIRIAQTYINMQSEWENRTGQRGMKFDLHTTKVLANALFGEIREIEIGGQKVKVIVTDIVGDDSVYIVDPEQLRKNEEETDLYYANGLAGIL